MESTTVLTTLTTTGKSILSLAVEVGSQFLGMEIVQIFLAATLISVSIGLVSHGIRSLRG